MKKLLPLIILASFFVSGLSQTAYAQTATSSSTATDSATASGSATASTSGTLELPDELLETGSMDVIVLFTAGMIFLAAGSTTAITLKNKLKDF